MTDFTVVTSCSLEGWASYGAKFVDTFLQYWPKEVALLIISEDAIPVREYTTHSVCHLDLVGNSARARDFLARHREHGWTQGEAASPRPPGIARRWPTNAGKNFRYDAYKFSKKVFAIELAAGRLDSGRLLWVDADVITFAPVPADLATTLLPWDAAISCLARPGYHSECGFVGYNLNHVACRPFITTFADLYATDAVFALDEWHDSWVFDYVRKLLNTPTHHIPHRSQSHPFINSELGKYMDHCKGKRKKLGRSVAVEQVVHKKITYWQ